MSTDNLSPHDLAHQLLLEAVAANDESHFTVAIDKAEEALELFWEVEEPCHGIAESLSVLGMAYAGSGDPDAARDARFNSLLNFIGDGDRDEVLALMDVARQALGLSQKDFAARFHINLRRLQDWEQGRVAPDSAMSAYLTLIEREPETVRRILEAA